jgi:hypothetical protein
VLLSRTVFVSTIIFSKMYVNSTWRLRVVTNIQCQLYMPIHLLFHKYTVSHSVAKLWWKPITHRLPWKQPYQFGGHTVRCKLYQSWRQALIQYTETNSLYCTISYVCTSSAEMTSNQFHNVLIHERRHDIYIISKYWLLAFADWW